VNLRRTHPHRFAPIARTALLAIVLLASIVAPLGVEAAKTRRDPIWGGTVPDAPAWLDMPESTSALYSEYDLDVLAGHLIVYGAVDASACVDSGLLKTGEADKCGLRSAQPKMLAWQNQFNLAILSAAQDTGVPPILLKNIFAWESQFWPVTVYINTSEYGFGHLTEMGADSALRWNPPFYDEVCRKGFAADTCGKAYIDQPLSIQSALRGVVIQQVRADCSACNFGLDLRLAARSIPIFAQVLLANASLVKQEVRSATGKSAADVLTYEDFWKFTLTSYNAGPGCFHDALTGTVRSGSALTWANLKTQLSPGCRGAVPYVGYVSNTKAYHPDQDPSVVATPGETATGTGSGTEGPTASATPSGTAAEPTATTSVTDTETPVATPTGVASLEPTSTPMASETGAPTATPAASETSSPTATPAASDTSEPTATPQNTATEPSATPPGETTLPTATPSEAPTGVDTPTATPTGELGGTITPTLEATPTATPAATSSETSTATPTSLPEIKPPHSSNQVVMKIGAGKRDQALQVLQGLGINPSQDVKTIPGLNTLVVNVPAQALEQVLAALQHNPAFEFVEPNYLAEMAGQPDDPGFSQQTNLWLIQAPDAWAALPSMKEALVAVVDTGVDTTHPDLSESLWENPGETGLDANGHDKRSNGIDDDGNGYVDDWQGWNMVVGNNNPADDQGHGTHLAGIIAAQAGNGQGIAGVAPNARILPVKVLDQTGFGTYAQVAEGIIYATNMGARVIELGFGGTGSSQLLQDAIDYAASHGVLVVAAAGNSGDSTPY